MSPRSSHLPTKPLSWSIALICSLSFLAQPTKANTGNRFSVNEIEEGTGLVVSVGKKHKRFRAKINPKTLKALPKESEQVITFKRTGLQIKVKIKRINDSTVACFLEKPTPQIKNRDSFRIEKHTLSAHHWSENSEYPTLGATSTNVTDFFVLRDTYQIKEPNYTTKVSETSFGIAPRMAILKGSSALALQYFRSTRDLELEGVGVDESSENLRVETIFRMGEAWGFGLHYHYKVWRSRIVTAALEDSSSVNLGQLGMAGIYYKEDGKYILTIRPKTSNTITTSRDFSAASSTDIDLGREFTVPTYITFDALKQLNHRDSLSWSLGYFLNDYKEENQPDAILDQQLSLSIRWARWANREVFYNLSTQWNQAPFSQVPVLPKTEALTSAGHDIPTLRLTGGVGSIFAQNWAAKFSFSYGIGAIKQKTDMVDRDIKTDGYTLLLSFGYRPPKSSSRFSAVDSM